MRRLFEGGTRLVIPRAWAGRRGQRARARTLWLPDYRLAPEHRLAVPDAACRPALLWCLTGYTRTTMVSIASRRHWKFRRPCAIEGRSLRAASSLRAWHADC